MYVYRLTSKGYKVIDKVWAFVDCVVSNFDSSMFVAYMQPWGLCYLLCVLPTLFSALLLDNIYLSSRILIRSIVNLYKGLVLLCIGMKLISAKYPLLGYFSVSPFDQFNFCLSSSKCSLTLFI